MGHYDDQYDIHYEEERKRKLRAFNELEKRFPAQAEKALLFKEYKEAFELFAKYL